MDQFANCISKDHRRRYGPLSRPKTRFINKAADVLNEGIKKGVYPHWNRIFVVGPMLRKPIKLQNILTRFPEVTSIEFRPLDPTDFGCYFELPWDEYKMTQDYCPLKKSQIIDFLALLDICGSLSKTSEPSVSEDWLLIKDALQALTDSRFTLIGLHSRCALATSCIEGLLCKPGEEIKKENLATRCGLLLSTINQSPIAVKNRIIEPYKVRSKFVHGHRSTAAKIAPNHKLLRSIEGYARRLIIITCHLSYSVRFGNAANKYRKQKLQTILNAASNLKNEVSKILHDCNRPNGIDIRPLLLR